MDAWPYKEARKKYVKDFYFHSSELLKVRRLGRRNLKNITFLVKRTKTRLFEQVKAALGSNDFNLETDTMKRTKHVVLQRSWSEMCNEYIRTLRSGKDLTF